MKPMTYQKILSAGISFAVLAPAGIAAAAEPVQSPAPADNSSAAAIEEIVVTAEHHSAKLQDTPIAIAAFSDGKLQSEKITTFATLAALAPDVQFSEAAGMGRVFIRGVGLDSLSPGSDPRVAIYSDQVYNARPQAVFLAFYDIERVEVLSGPQGTLYGRNATAGSVNVISHDPTETFGGYGTISLGNYGLVQTEGAAGGPLTDEISGRLAFQTTNHSGYGHNIGTGEDVDDADRKALRGKLKVKPTDNASIVFEADYATESDHSGAFHFLKNSPGNEDFGEEQGYAVASNPRDTAGVGPFYNLEAFGGSAIATVDLGEFAFTSVTGYRHVRSGQVETPEPSAADFLPAAFDEKSDEITQELRLARSFGPVDVLVGGYFFHESNSVLTAANFSSAYFPAFAQPLNCCIGIPKEPGPFLLTQGAYEGGSQNTDAYALFTQETFHITSDLGLDVGGRYSFEKRDEHEFFETELGRPAGAQPVFAPDAVFLQQRKSWNSLDPKVTLHYKVTPDILAYATYTTGFKSGGFNVGFIQAPFNPEKLADWEGGIKADFFEHHLRLDLAAFHYKYSNLQVNIADGIRLVTTNAGGADVDGLEAQISAAPLDENLDINVNVAWLNARYTSYKTADPGRLLLGTLDLAGNRLQYAPRWKLNGEISYTIDTRWGVFTPHADLTWTDHLFFSQFNVNYNEQNCYLIGNLYLDYDFGTGWTASAFVKNVTDKLYTIASTEGSFFQGFPMDGNVGDPRTFGVSLTNRF